VRIVRQIALIETLLDSGHQQMAETALELLDTFRDVLETWRADLVRIERVRVPPG
jgi:hypothetical protein